MGVVPKLFEPALPDREAEMMRSIAAAVARRPDTRQITHINTSIAAMSSANYTWSEMVRDSSFSAQLERIQALAEEAQPCRQSDLEGGK